MDGMSIGQAVICMKNGQKVARGGWNGKNMWIKIMYPDAYGVMTLPYVYMKTVDKQNIPWLCSQADLLADDWEIVK